MEADTGRTSGWRRLLLCFSPLTLFPSPHFSFPSQDAYLNTTLNTLEDLGLLDDTVVIKTADHGEMAMSHQGQVKSVFFAFFFRSFFLETNDTSLSHANKTKTRTPHPADPKDVQHV